MQETNEPGPVQTPRHTFFPPSHLPRPLLSWRQGHKVHKNHLGHHATAAPVKEHSETATVLPSPNLEFKPLLGQENDFGLLCAQNLSGVSMIFRGTQVPGSWLFCPVGSFWCGPSFQECHGWRKCPPVAHSQDPGRALYLGVLLAPSVLTVGYPSTPALLPTSVTPLCAVLHG